MSGLFEHLAATDDSALIAQRKASAVAHKRVMDRFGAFLANSTSEDRVARLSLIEDDLTSIVSQVVDEYGGDAQRIESAIKHSLMPGGDMSGGLGGSPSASMPDTMGGAPGMGGDPNQQGQSCPQCGGPMVNGACPGCQAGVGGAGAAGAYGMNHSMPQTPSTGPILSKGGFCDKCHAWKTGPKAGCTCDADEGAKDEPDDKSDDKSSFDDDKKDDKNPFESAVHTARRPKMCPYHSEVTDISLGAGEPKAGYDAMNSHAWGDNHCKGGYQGTCNFRPAMVTQKFWDDKQNEYAERAQERDLERQQQADLSLDTEPIMHAEPLPDEPGKEGVSDIDGELENAPSAVGGGELAMSASTKEAEALKTVDLKAGDESALGGPSPKIDKGNSGDQNGWSLEPIDTEMDGSPKPTRQQDITDAADYGKEDFLDQTHGQSESQSLPSSDDAGFTTERNIPLQPTKTWNSDEGFASPVTRESLSYRTANQWIQERGGKFVIIQKGTGKVLSTHDSKEQAQQSFEAMEANKHGSVDPDKNPIRELMEEYSGFLMPNQVEAAVQDWKIG